MTRHEQFQIIASAKRLIVAWADEATIPLHAVEFVVPFVATDFGLSVWFFYKTNTQLGAAQSNTWSEQLQAAFLKALASLGYDSRWLAEVIFVFDSHENVQKEAEGSYFLRMR